MGQVATSPLPLEGCQLPHSRGQNQKWPTCGPGGYNIPVIRGVTTASQWGAQKEMAHMWAKWLRNPCRVEGPHRFTDGGRIRGGPPLGRAAT